MKEPATIIPAGTLIRTHAVLDSTQGMLVAAERLNARVSDTVGTIKGVVAGHGGDVYWVEHNGGKVAAYCWSEFSLVEASS